MLAALILSSASLVLLLTYSIQVFFFDFSRVHIIIIWATLERYVAVLIASCTPAVSFVRVCCRILLASFIVCHSIVPTSFIDLALVPSLCLDKESEQLSSSANSLSLIDSLSSLLSFFLGLVFSLCLNDESEHHALRRTNQFPMFLVNKRSLCCKRYDIDVNSCLCLANDVHAALNFCRLLLLERYGLSEILCFLAYR